MVERIKASIVCICEGKNLDNHDSDTLGPENSNSSENSKNFSETTETKKIKRKKKILQPVDYEIS